MKALQRLVVIALLGVWCFPAVGLAKPLPAAASEGESPPLAGPAAAASRSSAPPHSEADDLAAREKQAADLANFKGGGVSIYIGSGALLVLVIILLIVLI